MKTGVVLNLVFANLVFACCLAHVPKYQVKDHPSHWASTGICMYDEPKSGKRTTKNSPKHPTGKHQVLSFPKRLAPRDCSGESDPRDRTASDLLRRFIGLVV